MKDEDKTKEQLISELVALREQMIKYGQLGGFLSISGDALLTINEQQRIISMNKGVEQIFNYSPEELIGKPLDVLIPEQYRRIHRRHINDFSLSIAPARLMGERREIVGCRKNGEVFPAEASIAKQEIDGRKTFTVVMRDITTRKQMEEEQLKTKKLESLGVLAGGIAHDFNNLLTGIYGSVELAKMFLPVGHRSHKYLESTMDSMERATQLTKQLLTFAKGGSPIKRTVSIGEVIAETAQFSLRGSKVILQVHIQPELWQVEADKGQLSQVISNLVINAQQSMPNGGIVTVTAENVELQKHRCVKIIVQDQGVGIAPQHLDKIFDPYFSTKQSGSGLGLASTYSIISNHNGRITVDSHLNQGTVFTIYLPAAAAAANETLVITKKPSGEPNTAPDYSAYILVMDDEEAVLNVIGGMLEAMGHRVSYAVDGKEAIATYQEAYESKTAYDLVILDLTIPGGMDGKEAAREILNINPKAKIIVSSGYGSDAIMANYEAFGFSGVVAKPYRFADLKETVRRVGSRQ